MLATRLLKQQHRHVETVFKQLLKDGTDKAALLKDLSDSLSAHMAIEQDIFYPAVFAVDPDLIHESYEEHSLAELGLKRLLITHPDDESFDARVTACKELIEHHVEEEEEDLFPKVEKKMDAAALKELGERMEQRFEEAKNAGFEANVPPGFSETSSDLALGRQDFEAGQEEEEAPARKKKAPRASAAN